MISVTVDLASVKGFLLELKETPAKILQLARSNFKEVFVRYLAELMNAEITLYLGRNPYERAFGNLDRNYRNGWYRRRFHVKWLGGIELKVPRDRNGFYHTQLLPRYKRYEEEIEKDLSVMFLTGTSTRNIELISEKLLGVKLSRQEVSNTNVKLHEGIEQWRSRDLSEVSIKYMYVDGTNFDMRVDNRVSKVCVLVAIGVDTKGHKTVLGFQSGDKESASSWREFFKDLKRRGLRGNEVQLGVMDGLAGLESVFQEEFPRAKVQRCQVHVARNVLAKVPSKLKDKVADGLRDIFYASSSKKAKEQFLVFSERFEASVPSAVKCLERSIENCLTFYRFPEEEWPSLRTTNPIERLAKEYKRRTKPMEIVGGEKSCYNLLAFISLKMEVGWRRTPLGSMSSRLRGLTPKKFTQNT